MQWEASAIEMTTTMTVVVDKMTVPLEQMQQTAGEERRSFSPAVQEVVSAGWCMHVGHIWYTCQILSSNLKSSQLSSTNHQHKHFSSSWPHCLYRDRGRGSFDDADGDRPPREELGPSKADTSSSWGADRRPREPSPDRPARGGGFGDSYTERDKKQTGGFADRYGEDRTSFADRGPSKADEEDRWSRKPVEPSSDRPSRGVDRNSSFGAPRSDSGDRWGARRSTSPADGAPAAGASERRRLNLSARTAPPKELPPIVAPTPKPASDEPESAVPKEQPDAPALPPKPKSNPFGTARPREEVLKEQGRDWKREERALEHSRVKQ
jgi:hypothetical protein